MMRRQFRILYRDFLFRIVDRDLLSTYATGDASQLLLQLVALLFFLSVCFSVPVLSIDPTAPTQVRLMFAWSVEHFLIATTMLVVGIFSVLSWDSICPGQRDVLVLGPLPIRAHTILLAKLAAVLTALSLAVVTLHLVSGIVWPLALNASARGHTVSALALTMGPAMPPVAASDLHLVLDKDLAEAVRNGPLAPGAGGGVVIGVYQRGVRQLFAYGAAAPDSVFPIASVTKPFTGLVLATMVQEQGVRFDEPVRELIPAARLPLPPGREITLLDLASRGIGKPQDPRFMYSNLGFGLLGHALSTRAGVDYATLVREAITAPLGMGDTVVELSPDQRRRFLQGYNEDREPVPVWEVDVLAGAGALQSTATDMLTWLEANVHAERLRSTTLSAALVASQQVRANVGSNMGIALDWMVNAESGDVQHGGAMAGYTADACFNPRRDVAAIVLSNVGPGTWVSGDVLGEHLRARLSGKPAVSIAEAAIPAGRGLRSGLRLLAAYWVTMFAAGVFIFGLAMSAQGLAASILPRRHFLRVSSALTALVQFSVRTLFRSAPHRVILAFYWGLGLAVAMIVVKTPRGQQLADDLVAATWQETSVPLLVSSMVMAGFAVLAGRLAFAMPRDLRANWIFRIVPIRGGPRYVAARRRALLLVSAAPVWAGWAAVLFWVWPWQPALGHVVALGLLSMLFVEVALAGTQKIPFTCSYLPGRSHAHVVIPVALVVLRPATIRAASFERDALQDPVAYAAMLGVLGIAWVGVRWRNARLGNTTGAQPEYEDAPAERLMSLEIWDARFPQGAGLTPTDPASRAQPQREV